MVSNRNVSLRCILSFQWVILLLSSTVVTAFTPHLNNNNNQLWNVVRNLNTIHHTNHHNHNHNSKHGTTLILSRSSSSYYSTNTILYSSSSTEVNNNEIQNTTSSIQQLNSDTNDLITPNNKKEEVVEEEEDDDDDEDWEYEEYDLLTESDFYNSEWQIGTLMDGKKKIKETWARLVVKDGNFIAVWGDSNNNGKWSFDSSSQFLSISKESFGGWTGKQIWAGTVDDFYFIDGTVRGWSPISPASVIGQWQAKRLGVDPEEAGIAPWFQNQEKEEDRKDGEKKEGGEEQA